MITDPDDPRLDDRLGALRAHRHPDRARGRRPRRAARSCSTASSSPRTSARRRSSARAASTSIASTRRSCTRSPRRSAPASTRSRCSRSTTSTPAIPPSTRSSSRCPASRAEALHDGLLADQEAAERLFGGSVTLDGRLILVADLADEELARAFAEPIGGDLSRAVTRRGDREFVDAPAPPPFELRAPPAVRHRRRRGRPDRGETTAARRPSTSTATGQVDFAAKRRAVDRVIVDGGGGQDALTSTSSKPGQDFDVCARRGRAIADGGVPVELDRVERLDLAAPGGPGRVNVGDLVVHDAAGAARRVRPHAPGGHARPRLRRPLRVRRRPGLGDRPRRSSCRSTTRAPATRCASTAAPATTSSAARRCRRRHPR